MKTKLENHERTHALWLRIKTLVEEEIDVLRRKNDNALDVEQTASLRGRVAALKDLLAIGEDVKPID